jgi:transcriptional regulator with XRE-family HTH domain
MTQREAARLAGISDARWRQLVTGYQSVGQGHYAPLTARAETLARMAAAVGVTPEQLAEVDREDAAAVLIRINREPAEPTHRSGPVGTGVDPVDLASLSPEELEAVRAVIRAMRAGHGGEG